MFWKKEPTISLAEHERLMQLERDSAARILDRNIALQAKIDRMTSGLRQNKKREGVGG